MPLSDSFRSSFEALWERAARHPFVLELGSGALPVEKFRRYFVQDYLFVDALRRVAGLAMGKAPDTGASREMHRFLDVLLGAEDALFRRAFEALGVAENEWRRAEPLPTTTAFGDFLLRTAYEGNFRDICTALYVVEGVYLDWAERLRKARASPGIPVYQEWIDIHTEEALGPFVRFLKGAVDSGPEDEDTRARLERPFETALRYEIRFWDMGYYGESWDRPGGATH